MSMEGGGNSRARADGREELKRKGQLHGGDPAGFFEQVLPPAAGGLPLAAYPMKRVVIHTDGACRGNPGPGGYGVVLVCGKHRLELSKGFARTTNNRMELLGVIVALETLKEACEIELLSDSRYVIDAMTKNWVKGWKAKGWKTASNQPVKNQDLWLRLSAAAGIHQVTWKWLRGHVGHKENERCDVLAVAAATARDLPVDAGFEG